MSKKDIEVELYFFLPEEGGRTIPLPSSVIYRPQFHYNERDWVADHKYPDVKEVCPGDTVRAFLTFMSPQEHFRKIYIGMPFLIREGARTIAKGRITKLLDLEASAIEARK